MSPPKMLIWVRLWEVWVFPCRDNLGPKKTQKGTRLRTVKAFRMFSMIPRIHCVRGILQKRQISNQTEKNGGIKLASLPDIKVWN